MKLISVIWKLINSKSKLTDVFVLQLDGLLDKLVEVADKGGVLVLRIGLDGDKFTISDAIELPKPKAVATPAKKKPSTKK